MKINQFKVKGIDRTPDYASESPDALLQIKQSIQIGTSVRGESHMLDISLEDDQVVEMVFEDGTSWISNSYTLQELFPEATVRSRDGGAVFELPDSISYDSTERNIFKKVAMKLVNIFVNKAVDYGVEKLARRLEERLTEERLGVFRLSAEMQLLEFSPDDSPKPYCLLIHGTASSIAGSFGEMKGTALMKYLIQQYGDRILAFQHRTLTENPLQNVLDLVKKLPGNSTLHLITTSRGGLVGEVLSRFCNDNESQRGFTATEMNLLKKEYPSAYFESQVDKLVKDIQQQLQNKHIAVEKFIRIACPAAGTTLASRRLDNFFNLTFNLVGYGTGMAANPVYSAFKNLISAVINSKNKVDVLPGLEVQNPDSPFIRVLNGAADPTNPGASVLINNSLVVIAGNSKPALNISALLIIASKLFFMRKNDLVVDTESMSLGTRRSGKVQQFFHEDSELNHFKYFENTATSQAVQLALEVKWGDKLPGFTEEQLSIPVETERNALLKLDGGQVYRDTVSGSKPILMLLPGIMGSNLSRDESLIWINYWKFITGGLKELTHPDVKATSLVSTSYRTLVEFLKDTYDVVTFPFDWRLSLEESATVLDQKILELMKYKQPIRLVGHSMGGVLLRDFMVTHRGTWEKLNASPGFRLLFLGSPLNGSFRIPAVLMGMDGIIGKLAKIDQFHSKKELLQIFSGFRGLLGLLPFSTEEGNDFSKRETWQRMIKGVEDAGWPLPSDQDLAWFADYRNRMKEGLKDSDLSNAVYIAGKDSATPCGYRLEDTGSGPELVFISTAEGDQSVTWETGIPPKLIERNAVYYVDVSHGSLACEPELFKGIQELLANGNTNLFSKTRPSVRGEEKEFRMPQYRDFDLTASGLEATLLGLGTKTKIEASEPPLRVSISQGDLFYAKYPVMAGHFEDDGILYAEKTIDQYLDGQLSNHHQLGIYPGEIGSSDVFLSEKSTFKGAIIIGLGDPGILTAAQLTKSVEQGVANYLLHLEYFKRQGHLTDGDMESPGISSLIVGCGYGGLSIETSIKAILQGVQNANIKVKNLKLEKTSSIAFVEFVELYQDKAVSCLYSISKIEKEESQSLRIIREGKGIKMLLGSRIRIPAEASEGWWNRITVVGKEENEVVRRLLFSTSTNSSREDEKELMSTPALMEGILEEISTNNQWTPERAKTIFELLIPNDFKEHLKRHGNINWILDSYTASYPWELLQDGVVDTKPICISAGMVRQLKTRNSRQTIKTVPKNNALVIADPDLKGFYSQLPGALEEGRKVASLLEERGMIITSSFKGNHSEIVEKLFRDDYKIIHLSGHGVFHADVTKGSGMVIGKNMFLSTREIMQMSSTPELVFVNCCHLGKSDGVSEELYQNRYRLAANIGTQLINNGVRCVIAAGWAVNDSAALEFAGVFYKKMFAGYNFGDAVKEARRAVYEKFGHTNTWGAYQCYGDPFYKFENLQVSQKRDDRTYLIAQEAEVDLMNLLNKLEIGKLPTAEYLRELEVITAAVDKAEVRNALITEKEALIYLELGEYELACNKFSQLLSMEEGTFSFSVAEKYCNARSKKIMLDYERTDSTKATIKAGFARQMDKVIRDLEILINLSPTSERLNMIGSAYKRQAYLSPRADKAKFYRKAAWHYQRGYSNYQTWYSLTNWLTLESALIRSRGMEWEAGRELISKETGYPLPMLQDAIKLLDLNRSSLSKNTERMSYWDMLACLNIRLCKFILLYKGPENEADLDDILQEITSLWKFAGSKGKRFAEIEHLKFVIDALSISEMEQTVKLKEKMNDMKDLLQKLI